MGLMPQAYVILAFNVTPETCFVCLAPVLPPC